MEIPDETDRLRRQAQRALRLARGITDDRAAQALKAYAMSLFEQLTSLEHQMISLRASTTEQQQLQPRDGDNET
jgi:DNA-binding PucR family transcriptional regulator